LKKPNKLRVLVTALAVVVLLVVAASPAPAQERVEVICTPPENGIITCTVGFFEDPRETFICVDVLDELIAFSENFDFEGENALEETLAFFSDLCGSEGSGGGGGAGGGGGGGGGAAAPLELTQETEQEAESGDVNQSFEVTSTGDNSNQCAGVQGVTNTGNPQNVTDLLQAVSDADDFEFEEVGSDITVSPESPTTCDQQVNQAASASG
jgi:hypothetical protein